MGGIIAQELALSHSEKVNKLIFFTSSSGGKYAQVSAEVMKGMIMGMLLKKNSSPHCFQINGYQYRIIFPVKR
jgi:hypothetical protein